MTRPTRRTMLTVAAIPLALALAMAASSQRLVDRWWPTFPHERAAHAADGSVVLRGTIEDANGIHPHVVTTRFVSLERVTSYQEAPGKDVVPVTLPDGQVLWRLNLHFATDPTTIVGACTVQVLDDARREYSPGVGFLKGVYSYTSCVPLDTPGPQVALSKGARPRPDELNRPPRYDRWYYLRMPASVRPDAVRVWFETPAYAEFDVSGSTTGAAAPSR